MSLPRLSRARLDELPGHVMRPTYDPATLQTGIVHLGLGAFHRAHQATYTEAVLAAGDRRWGIHGVSLRSPETRNALGPQDGLYTIASRDADSERLAVIGAITGIGVAPENPVRVLTALGSPSVKIVSLTVTEKGYCHDPATGDLNSSHSDIQWDLAHPHSPRSAPGFILRALAQRRAAGIAPFTVLTCDNLPHNGRTVRNVVIQLAELVDKEIARHIAEDVAFPATMVDRIVPATMYMERDRISTSIGLQDAWPVVTEPFSQWVIEDRFPQGRPDWQAQFTNDVAAWETMKLRLLNGAHSCIAYLGYLAGHETVAAAMADPAMAAFVQALMDREVTPVLKVPPGADVEAYKSDLLKRFRNPALHHRTWQIAMDGSQKLPQRLLATVRERLQTGGSIARLALGIAAWMIYVSGSDEKGRPIDVRDPLAEELRKQACDHGPLALINIPAIFGTDLPAHAGFRDAVEAALRALQSKGVAATLREGGLNAGMLAMVRP